LFDGLNQLVFSGPIDGPDQNRSNWPVLSLLYMCLWIWNMFYY